MLRQSWLKRPPPQVQDLIVAARPDLINEEIWDLEGLFSDYEGVFVMKGSVYRWTDGVYYRIDVGEAQPIRQPLRRLSLA
jgi:hypothetical protein